MMRFLKARIIVLGLTAMFLSLSVRAQQDTWDSERVRQGNLDRKFVLHAKRSEGWTENIEGGYSILSGYRVVAESETIHYVLTCATHFFLVNPNGKPLDKNMPDCVQLEPGDYWAAIWGVERGGHRVNLLDPSTGKTLAWFAVEKQEEIPAAQRTQQPPPRPVLYKWVCPVHADFAVWTKSAVAQLQHKRCGRTLVSTGKETIE